MVALKNTPNDVARAAQLVVDSAFKSGSQDNISCMVVVNSGEDQGNVAVKEMSTLVGPWCSPHPRFMYGPTDAP